MTLREKIAEKYAISREWSCYDEVIMERCLRFSDEILNLPELKEMQEKAARCDRAFKYAPSNEQERLEMNKKIDEWREQAALYDEVLHLKDIFMRWKKGRDLILEGLEVEEKFKEYEGFYNDKSFIRRTRPATPEEVREVLEIVLSSDGFSGYFRLVQNQEWRLKSGAVLRLKERV